MTGISRDELLHWEQQARRSGSSIEATELVARWTLDQVFDRTGHPAGFGTSALLRAIQACLILAPQSEHPSDQALAVANQVSLGPLLLRFEGQGQLIGRRPLLQFSFAELMIKLGALTLHRRTIPTPDARSMPFFALIKLDHHAGTLVARGRGGGLAVWRRDSTQSRHGW